MVHHSSVLRRHKDTMKSVLKGHIDTVKPVLIAIDKQ